MLSKMPKFIRRPSLSGCKKHTTLQAFVLVVLCLLALAAYAGPAPAAEQLANPQGKVAKCFDGDTIKLTDRRTVRLAGIDTPEMDHGKTRPQYYAREAMDQLTQLAQGKEVRLVAVDAKGKDHYGRIVADVVLPDGRSLSDTLVRNGAAFVYPHSDLNPHFVERLRKFQHEAIAARRGLWAHLLTLPAAKKTYLGNRESMRFFPTDCAEVQHIKPRNRVFFGTLMDAFMAGYAPARPCNFWPTVK
ncbi:thermonuclease family protein [Desulfovibrio desulfuricans]|uniref:thermonuclease family protein n=1 Tax=Desulfovibrio desulfuricans TaxID=876 RepID=UPI0035B45A29